MVRKLKTKSSRIPKQLKIATLDFETDPFKFGREPHPFCAGIWDGEVYRQFWGEDNCVINIVEYIRDELQGYTIYAHNGGKFDYFFMLKYFDPNIKIINGRIARAKIGKATLTDSLLILPAPLSTYKKDVFNYKKMEKKVRLQHKQEILKYLKADCIYLHEWVSEFIGLFGKKLTIAGTAYNELKNTGYDPKNTYEGYDEKFRPFYYGGRVSTFKRGQINGDHEYIDINSAYPYAMMFKHAYGDKVIEVKTPPLNFDGYFAVIDAISYGCLPARDIESKKLLYHDDEQIREYHCTGWEIKAGLDTGTLKVIKYKKIYVHEQIKSMKEFVTKFYNGRLEYKKNGNVTFAYFFKIVMNSCYGKFGQDGRQFKNYCLTGHSEVPENYFELEEAIIEQEKVHKKFGDKDDLIELERLQDKQWIIHSEIHDSLIWEQPAPVNRYNNVATAASITGYVRAYLWRAICDSVEPVYCDTDSIMCKKFNGEMGNKLGQWKLEANLDRIYIGGRKFYSVHIKDDKSDDRSKQYKTACKGGRLTPLQIMTVIKTGKSFTWEKKAPAYSLKYGARFLRRKINRQF